MDKKFLLNYIKNNKGIVIAIIVIILALSITCTQVLALLNKKNNPTNSQQNIRTQEFIVFDYEEQKLLEQENKLKNTKNAEQNINAEEINETIHPQKDDKDANLLTQIPIKNNKVTFNIKTNGRRNPFAPYVERSLTTDGRFDIIEPPQYIPEDAVDQDLMQTTVSGILYNEQKSSAIINVNGTDQLVNKGDKIAGFQIINITRTKVLVKKGHNVISAGVGESLETPELTYNEVYNLSNKFGGKYNTAKKEVILINGKEY